MTVRRFLLLAVVVAVTAFGCSTAKSVIGVPNTGDPSVTIKSAETRWLLIKNPRFGDVASEPEYVWVEEDKTPTTFGTVVFGKNIDLTRLDEPAIASLGIGRKFQKPTVFENHTVRDNLLLALAGLRSWYRLLLAAPTKVENNRLEEILSIIRMGPQQHMLAARLSHGQKQWLEIGMLLAQNPKLLLVDEPVAGMTDVETETTAHVLREVNKSHSVVVVEHDMSFVRALGVKVTVLHEGSTLAEGSLDQVSADPRVVEVYLGR